MKKIVILTVAFVFVCVPAFIGYDSAASWSCDATGGADCKIEGWKASNNVTVNVNSVVQSYAATSGHLNGDRTFGTASDSPKIYYTTKDKGATPPAPSASDSSAFSGWSSL